jgi:hypothetical protein
MMQNSTEKTVPAGIKRDTPGILFQNALRLVKEHGHYAEAEPIVDYALADRDERKLTNYEFDFRAVVSPGSSEGIYIDCYLEGIFDRNASTRCNAGTIKTLREDVDAYRIMGALAGYLTVYARKYVNENLDRFEPVRDEQEE